MFRRAWRWAAFGCTFLIGTAATAFAGELTNRELLPADALAVLEISRPAGVAVHPLVREVIPLLYESEGYRQALASPQAVQTRDVLEVLKERWGVDLLEGFDAISAGGIAVSLQPGPPPRICIVATARDAPALTRFVDVGQQLVREAAARNGNAAPFEARTDEGRPYTRVGDAFYAVAGKRLLLANQEGEMRRMLKTAGTGDAPAATETGPGARLTVDVRKLRQDPKFAAGLELPTKNFGLLNLVGGWVDLLRRSDTAVAELRLPGDRVELSLKFPVGSEGATPGLAALAGLSGKQGSLPLLRPEGAVYSAGIYRDFSGLWSAREQLAQPEHLKQLNDGAATFSKQNSDITLDDLLGWIGPHYRFVVCPQTRDAYNIKPPDHIPALAMALDLRNPQQFEDRFLPRLQFIGGIIAVGGKMLNQTVDYGGTKLYLLRFSEDPGSLATADRLRFNFEPTYSLTRKHLIIGSTSDIVRQVIDEIDRQGEAGLTSLPVNESQRLSGKALGLALRQIREGFVRQGVLQDGLTIPGAERELDTLVRVLETLGEATVTSTSSERETEYLLRVGKNLP